MRPSRSTPSSAQPTPWLRLLALAPTVVLGLLLVACTTVKPPAGPTAPSAQAPEPAATAASALRGEQRWLQSWFEGTPVRIAMIGDGVLTIDVPREFCFDAGRSHLKPALAAVLDKVAESLRRNARSKLTQLAAPADATASGPLAAARAAAVHKHLRDRGVPVARLGEPGPTAAAAVQLRIEATPG